MWPSNMSHNSLKIQNNTKEKKQRLAELLDSSLFFFSWKTQPPECSFMNLVFCTFWMLGKFPSGHKVIQKVPFRWNGTIQKVPFRWFHSEPCLSPRTWGQGSCPRVGERSHPISPAPWPVSQWVGAVVRDDKREPCPGIQEKPVQFVSFL